MLRGITLCMPPLCFRSISTAIPSACLDFACPEQATTFVLNESASGYAIFEVKEFDEISQAAQKLQEAVT